MILFEIVGFPTATPLEQVAQSMALEYSINSAAEQMAEAGLDVELARSTAGDGFLYVWNRRSGVDADLRTYVAMLLTLVNNAITHRSGVMDRGLLPALRTAFHRRIAYYSYHPIEGTRPHQLRICRRSGHHISLARLLKQGADRTTTDRELPERPGERVGHEHGLNRLPRPRRKAPGETDRHADRRTRDQARCAPIVSGGAIAGKRHNIVKYLIDDKHGFHHHGVQRSPTDDAHRRCPTRWRWGLRGRSISENSNAVPEALRNSSGDDRERPRPPRAPLG